MLAVAFALSVVCTVSLPASSSITVRVDPRIELFTIVFRLAGSEEFNRDAARSPYASDVDQWFLPFRDHAAVRLARQLRDQRGIHYSAIASLAVHVDAVPTLEERVPFEPLPERLDDRWSAASAAEFLDQLRGFVRDTRFEEFFAQHAGLYRDTAQRLEEVISGAQMDDWVRDFFGERATGAGFTVIPSLLNGHHNYGSGMVFPDGHLELSPVVGIWRWDDRGCPLFDDEHIFTIVHEFTHNFANPVIDRHEEELAHAGRSLFASVETVMRAQAYATWQTMLYESLVRACVVRYLAKHDGDGVAVERAWSDAKRGFRWVGDLADLLAREYEPDRRRYPDLDAFAPRLVTFFAMIANQDASAPQVVSIEPADGATEVDPATRTIRVTFDRPMKEDPDPVISGDDGIPGTIGKPEWDARHKALTVSVALAPRQTYRLALNGAGNTSCQSTAGVPLAPVVVTFATGARKP